MALGITRKWRKVGYLFLTGIGMGSADVVPGVSGGTVALVMGIYKELIHSIKKVTGPVIALLLQFKIREAIKATPFLFLLPVALGALTAVFALANLITFLLHAYPVYLWALFFGFVLASAVIVKKRVNAWNYVKGGALIAAAVIAFFVVGAVPMQTSETLPALFISGVIAICATILPGISGSFLLVIMGKYEQVLTAVAERDFVTLGVFALGAVLGLALFARLLSWLFVSYHDVVMASLAGLMLGSLRKIWPWQEVVATRVNSEGELVPIVTNNVLPPAFDISFVIAVLFCLFAMGLVVYVDGRQTKQNSTGL